MLNYETLQQLGRQAGIDKVGVSPVTNIADGHLDEWLNRGYQGRMSYLERNQEKRLAPAELLLGARSVISIFVNYHIEQVDDQLAGIISKYARGKDYHPVLKDLLHDLAEKLFEDRIPGLSRKERALVYRVFVDSAPVMEKYWAAAAGIGWQGKHSNIITREYGSWGFLGEIITTEDFDQYDLPIPDHCGTCTACLEACPTQAITEPYVVNGSRCISYATIELDTELSIPEDIRSKMGDWLFGCDICQDVCPWNRFAKPGSVEAFMPVAALQSFKNPNFHQMDTAQFQERYGETPLARPGLAGMQRNQQVKG